MIPVADALKLPDGTILEAIGGRLTVTSPRVEKHRDDGEAYTQQTFSLNDGTGEILGTIYDHFQLEPHDGKKMVFASMKAKNNRFGGVTIKADAASRSLFSRKPAKPVIRVSKAGALHSPETYAHLCGTTKRPEQKLSPTVGE